MSIKAVNWALNSVRCTPDLKVILIAMGERADDHGQCWPSQADISEKSCIPLRTLKRKMATLKDAGVFDVSTRQVKANLRKNTYRLHLESEFDLLSGSKNNGAKMTPLNSAKLAPSLEKEETNNGANLAPLNSANLTPSSEQWCHPDDTINGATHVAHEPPLNHQSISNNNTTATEHPVFQVPNRRTKIAMCREWQPSPHVFENLETTRGMPRTFPEDAVPEFIMYWMGTSFRQGEYDSKFFNHCLHQWEKFLTHEKTAPKVIASDWEPDSETIRKLMVERVDMDFVWESSNSFRMYWRERGEARHAWNTMFYDNCLRMWRNRPKANDESQLSTFERLTDRSWADGPLGIEG